MPTRGNADDARAAYRRAIDSSDARAATEALDRLVSLLREQGNVDGARAVLRQAIDSGHPHEVPYALVELGCLLRERGDVAGARAAFQLAADFGDPSLAWLAIHYLQNWPWDSGSPPVTGRS